MTTFTDDFNRSNGAPGANWVDATGLWAIVSNQLSSGTVGGTIVIRAATAMATNDNSAQVTIAATGSVSHGVWCRGNTGFTNGYLFRNDGSSWTLFSVVGGSFTSIGSFAAAAVAGDVVKVQAVGSTIKGYVNGVQRVSVTDTAVATGTSVGLRAESTNLLRFDDFVAADVTSGVTGDAALSGTATLSATGLRAAAGSAALAATATLTADGTVARSGAAALAGTASLTATGQRATSGDTALSIAAALTADGQRGANTGAALAASAALTATGQVAHSGDAALTATAMLTADGTAGPPPASGAAALAATSTLTAAGNRTAVAAAALAATAALTAAGTTSATRSAAIVATATLTATGTTLSTRDDVDVTVGAPYSPWSAGEPYVPAWTVETPQSSDWEVGAPC